MVSTIEDYNDREAFFKLVVDDGFEKSKLNEYGAEFIQHVFNQGTYYFTASQMAKAQKAAEQEAESVIT